MSELEKVAADALWMAWLRHRDARDLEDEIERNQARAKEMREIRDEHLAVFSRLGVDAETALNVWGGDRLRNRGAAHRAFIDEGLAVQQSSTGDGES